MMQVASILPIQPKRLSSCMQDTFLRFELSRRPIQKSKTALFLEHFRFRRVIDYCSVFQRTVILNKNRPVYNIPDTMVLGVKSKMLFTEDRRINQTNERKKDTL
jgi:hypothetical protein